MQPRNFVVSGSARAGLGRTARLMSALGAECGHEAIFNPDAYRAGPALHWPATVLGEASWFAAPVIERLPEDLVVIHQVRHPLSVVSELVGSGFFQRPGEDRWFAEDFLGDDAAAEPLERALLHWTRWNLMIEDVPQCSGHPYRRFRAELLSGEEVDGALGAPSGAIVLEELTKAIRLAQHRKVCTKALGRLGGSSASDFAPRRLGWEDLPAGSARDRARELAARYGYAA